MTARKEFWILFMMAAEREAWAAKALSKWSLHKKFISRSLWCRVHPFSVFVADEGKKLRRPRGELEVIRFVFEQTRVIIALWKVSEALFRNEKTDGMRTKPILLKLIPEISKFRAWKINYTINSNENRQLSPEAHGEWRRKQDWERHKRKSTIFYEDGCSFFNFNSMNRTH